MAGTIQCGRRSRKDFGKIPSIVEIPNLIEVQKRSYETFLQKDVPSDRREEIGLQAVFKSVFPIADYNDNALLEFDSYHFGDPKYTVEECHDRGMTFAIPLKVTLRLVVFDHDKEAKTRTIREQRGQEVYLGELPLMTDKGTFIINGTERVVVSQLQRSAGVFFDDDKGKTLASGKPLYSARVIPYRGSWVEFDFDANDILHVRVDRRRKMLATAFLRAFWFLEKGVILSDEEILGHFYDGEEVLGFEEGNAWVKLHPEAHVGARVAEDVKPPRHREPLVTAGKTLTAKLLEKLVEANVEIYRRLRPGDPPTVESARALFRGMFMDPRRYDLARVGRFMINKKLQIEAPLSVKTLRSEDIVAVIRHLLMVKLGSKSTDDIDHLGNRRVRSVGELLENQFRVGLTRMERAVKERMSISDITNLMPHDLINAKPVSAAVKEFFGSSQLSQFMDQTNPLAELTHKRRLSALGPRGLSRERAGFEVRDVHPTHYGRICPIETPEGPNIGLISSLSTYARTNEFGFIETPYRKVEKGRVRDEIEFLTALKEERFVIAQANAGIDKNGKFVQERVSARKGGEFRMVPPEELHYMDVSPKQLVSVAASLIPFLENDDANRALMGSNMQRQAVPLLQPEAPLVGTGMEHVVARDSGAVLVAKRAGVVEYVSADRIVIRAESRSKKTDPVQDLPLDIFNLTKYRRSNQNTCINQKPIVRKGQKVAVGDVIADGPGTDQGELALGRNVLVAFMPWGGYNFEDAILVSERLVKDDRVTSIHIEESEIQARDTKLGKEEVTRDIPNVAEEALKDLDDSGIVRIGAKVKPSDILVGKTALNELFDPTNKVRRVTKKSDRIERPDLDNFSWNELKKIKVKEDEGLAQMVRRIEELAEEQIGIYDSMLEDRIGRLRRGDDLPPGVIKMVKVYVAVKRKLSVGDKMAGRHGNKGVVSKVLPEEDMPFLPDGTPVEIVLNPLGVPSRMNVGQILETHLGWAARALGLWVASPVFDGATEAEIKEHLTQAGLPTTGKTALYDGRTGKPFHQEVTVGQIYILKLAHLVDDKMHARSIGPYSLVTQQPLGGKAQFGGQRFGEMEVWALEAYGAAHTLQEMLTVKSDDVEGRNRIYEAIVKGENFL